MMRKISLFILLSISSLNVFSQIDNGSIVFSVNGNYSKISTESGVTKNLNQMNQEHLSIGPSVEYFITNHIAAGIGFDYDWSKETRYNKLSFNYFTQAEKMDIKSKILIPNIFFKYYFHLSDKLYLNTGLKFGYGVYKSKYNTTYAGLPEYHNGITDVDSYVRGEEYSSEYDYFGVQISPELTYFFSKRFGLNLGFGDVEYGIIDWKKDNSNWIVNFNPNFWTLGFKIRI